MLMRTHNALARLAAAGALLHAQADSLLGPAEEELILERIVASDRRAHAAPRRLRAVLVLVGVALVAAAATVASLELGGGGAAAPRTAGHHHLALTGPRIELAGYHFRTPAGFEDSNSPCTPSATARFSAAASADGGCVEAFFMLNTGKYAIVPDAKPVEVAGTPGFLVSSQQSLTLYAPLPQMGEYFPYLMLVGKGLTADQLVAIAESGLPAHPGPGITTTCTENCG
jgi:hypothetical protein